MTIGIVVAYLIDEVGDHLLEFSDEGLGIVLFLLYFAKFLLPDAREFGTL